ncbi:MAG: hypothetical protein LBR08_06465 [Bacteroidales bacterium]|nr:hypothetical protein [Bacteroidales bacterium]
MYISFLQGCTLTLSGLDASAVVVRAMVETLCAASLRRRQSHRDLQYGVRDPCPRV